MSEAARPLTGQALAQAHFRYFPYIMAAFVAILLLSNIIGASKPSYIVLPGGTQWAFGAGVLFFPVSYIIGDILTEVYGYANARRVIWTGFAALVFMAFMAAVVVALPPAADWPGQEAYEFVFGNSWRIVLASTVAFWAGEFANAYVLARLKVITAGRFLWMRTIGSTVVGQGLDSAIFYPLAGRAVAMGYQGRLGGVADTRNLLGGRLPEAPRRGGGLRQRHRLFTLRQPELTAVGSSKQRPSAAEGERSRST